MDDLLNAEEIARRAEAFFGQPVQQILAPGGKNRRSYRVQFEDRSVIVSKRKLKSRFEKEAFVLRSLCSHSDSAAQYLGGDADLMYQTDVGRERLAQRIHVVSSVEQTDLAMQAVGALFDVHEAGRKAGLKDHVWQLGATSAWVESFVDDIAKVPQHLGFDVEPYDRDGLCAFIGTPAVQFIKWDCRAGNAGVDDQGTVRWFDFEYSGVRHGAEDFAWLIADECWPVSPEAMLDVIKAQYREQVGRSWDEYRSYLEVYTSLHAVQRVLQILGGVARKGWISENQALRYDDVGINPKFGKSLCETGVFMSQRNALTAPLGVLFEKTAACFDAAIKRGGQA